LAVAAWFLQTWSIFAVAWTYWGVAGVALGLSRVRAPATADAPAEARGPASAPAPYPPAPLGAFSRASR